MRTTTIVGKRRTNPRGMEMDELPFNRMRRRKKDSFDDGRDFSNLKSSRGGAV